MRLWAAELKSGKYKQGRNKLCKDGKYCCLGVACEAAIKRGVKLKVEYDDGYKLFDDSTAVLPRPVINWLNCATNVPDLYVPEKYVKMYELPNDKLSTAYLNDCTKMSFAEIGECVEYTIEKLMGVHN